MSDTPVTQRPVNIYAESTPNPAAMKFVCNFMLLPENSVEYFSRDEAKDCPIARDLFGFSGVTSVFIKSNFITVTKDGETEWYEIVNIVREFIRGYLMEGGPLLTAVPQAQQPPVAATISSDTAGTVTLDQIAAILEEYVKPAVEQDGGEIVLRSYDSGVVTVALKGSCQGCPSSTVTLKNGIENLLKQMIPEVTAVVAETE